ncbi:long-chain-fatty-acid--CoA ligase [Paractinoplanes deccanensis]|uniref:Long-chain-fatty-acid--CoA ligase n=1 Tax=Paractinoplanes deccanensis TaxID=113561 RepID=A0ABQ3YJM5_9ACTN|nr:class I adenylate-forming enzyme family protein [Actinoplanes deccanensis]GID80202.1 long-chain-fatty-acid--CoA ligase [Actinoplanes deccanensis]
MISTPPTVHGLLDEATAEAPGRTALVTDDISWTYGELADRTRRTAAWLRERGVGRGDRVLLLAPNSAELVCACYAISRAGGVFVVVNNDTKAFQLRHIIANAEPALILTDRVQRIPSEAEVPCATLSEAAAAGGGEPPAWPGISSDPACLIYTSGSTAAPKGVVSPHRTLRFAVDAIAGRLGLRADDRIGCLLPLSFDYGLYQVFLAARARATLVLGDPAQVGPGLTGRLERAGVTVLPLVPSLASALLRLGRRAGTGTLPRLRAVTNTGARLAPETIDELRAAFPGVAVYAMFGLTECKRVAILDPAELDRRRGSVGRPLTDTECLVVDEQGRPLPAGETGELVVRGPHVMAGYWRAPEQTARRFRPWGPAAETALFTGDLCALDEDGYLYFRGRFDDVYKSRGHRVSTLEVEAAALDIPGVAEAAVVPPDGDSDGARIFVTGTANAATVLAGLRERLEAAKVPDGVRVLEQLPLNTNRKVDRHQLRALDEAAR